jgi:hexosaminidase
MSAVGVYNIAPDMTIEDDPRFEFRSLSLDLTKHIFPVATIKKVLKLMSTYKLNKLELNLGGDDGWRLEIPDMPTLVQVSHT